MKSNQNIHSRYLWFSPPPKRNIIRAASTTSCKSISKKCMLLGAVFRPRLACVLKDIATGWLEKYVCRLVLAVAAAVLAASPAVASKNFIVYNTLEDGELETRIKWKDITAKEVTAGRKLGIKFRQLTDGKHFIQLIYNEDDQISDCEYLQQKQSVTDFVDTFTKDVHLLTTVYNATIVDLEQEGLPANLKQWMTYKKLRKLCKKKHTELKKMLRYHRKMTSRNNSTIEESLHGQNSDHKNHDNNSNHLYHHNNTHNQRTRRATSYDHDKSWNYLLFPGTLWCGHSDAASNYTKLGLMSGTDKCCRKHDFCRYNIPGFGTRYGYFNSRPFTISQCMCDMSGPGRGETPSTSTNFTSQSRNESETLESRNRNRRDLGDYLRIPGTKWCGKGKSASKYTDMGMFSKTDKCCRRHDSACPYWISGFETKYGLFNWRVNTIMHCHCDERFRTCLKRVGSNDANLVGKLFFNVVQTKCFVFKKKPTCVSRSWWGKCIKRRYKRQAVLKENMSY